MSYGMTYDEFWHGDVRAHRMYKKAHETKVTEQNTLNWILGSYVYQAIGAWSPILRAFSKARKPGEYLEHPFDIYAAEREAREEKKARERYERVQRNVAAFAKAFNEKRNSERKEVDDDRDKRN